MYTRVHLLGLGTRLGNVWPQHRLEFIIYIAIVLRLSLHACIINLTFTPCGKAQHDPLMGKARNQGMYFSRKCFVENILFVVTAYDV